MDAEYASYYTKEVMEILIREFMSPDDEMKKIVLKVVKQCCATDGVEPDYIRTDILPHFFKHFWHYRMAIDRRNYRQLVDTTVELANKVCSSSLNLLQASPNSFYRLVQRRLFHVSWTTSRTSKSSTARW